jgi:hypothetical protein
MIFRKGIEAFDLNQMPNVEGITRLHSTLAGVSPQIVLQRLRMPGLIRARSVLQEPGDQGHAHEIGKARCLHFGHEIGPVDFNGARADAEIEGNLLVGMAGNESLEHVTLAAREAREPGIDLRPFSMALMIALVPRQRGSHRREQ